MPSSHPLPRSPSELLYRNVYSDPHQHPCLLLVPRSAIGESPSPLSCPGVENTYLSSPWKIRCPLGSNLVATSWAHVKG